MQLGNELGVTVVAEGVETAQQQQDLFEMGCTTGQGFYLTKPQPANELVNALFNQLNSNVVSLGRLN
ncbi:EAL domain-containing protein [Vibrio sinaloensis]|nr:EAL domain-containing protein [Vibrio sinaloensis]